MGSGRAASSPLSSLTTSKMSPSSASGAGASGAGGSGRPSSIANSRLYSRSPKRGSMGEFRRISDKYDWGWTADNAWIHYQALLQRQQYLVVLRFRIGASAIEMLIVHARVFDFAIAWYPLQLSEAIKQQQCGTRRVLKGAQRAGQCWVDQVSASIDCRVLLIPMIKLIFDLIPTRNFQHISEFWIGIEITCFNFRFPIHP